MTKSSEGKPRENKLKERLADAGKVPRAAAAVPGEAASITLPAPGDPDHIPESTPHVRTPVDAEARRVLTREHFDVRMKRWTTYVDRDVLLQMQSFARRTGTSRSQIVTEGIAMWLRENGGA